MRSTARKVRLPPRLPAGESETPRRLSEANPGCFFDRFDPAPTGTGEQGGALKITPQPRAILDLLMGDSTHPSAQSLYRRLLARMPDVSRTTVSNTLRALVDIAAWTVVNYCAEGAARYDADTEAHHHLICTDCHP